MADRTLIPGNWRADGSRPFLHRAVVFITGQGDELATPFADSDTELACDIGPSAERVIQPPEPLSDDMRARFKRRALYLSALGFGALAGLLEACEADAPDAVRLAGALRAAGAGRARAALRVRARGRTARPTEAQWNAKKSNEDSMAAKAWWSEVPGQRRRPRDRHGRRVRGHADAARRARGRAQAARVAGHRLQRVLRVLDRQGDRRVLQGPARPRAPDRQRTVRCWTSRARPTSRRRASAALRRARIPPPGAHYTAGLAQAATGCKVKAFVFAAVTSAPPVLAVPYVLPDDLAEQARGRAARTAGAVRALPEGRPLARLRHRLPAAAISPPMPMRSNEVEVSYDD
jgi:hypothetical protein